MNVGLPLELKRIAVPETRELDVLSGLLERRGAEVLRFPLISIYDTFDTTLVQAWIQRFNAEPPEWLVLLTGEGLRRLLSFIQKHDMNEASFVKSLSECKIISRGPKPAKVLRTLGLEPTMLADAPTTHGVIASLEKESVEGLKIAVQLYGADPNQLLMDYLEQRGAIVDCVAPYRYSDAAETLKVIELINLIEQKDIDVIAFTSKSQVDFLYRVAAKSDRVESLTNGLNNLIVASVGPVVSNELEKHHVQVKVMPKNRFFMKPMVTEIVSTLQSGSIKSR